MLACVSAPCLESACALSTIEALSCALQDFGIESGARLTVIITRAIRTKAQVEALVDELMACNPRANRAELLQLAEFDADGNLQNWYTRRMTSMLVHTFSVDI